MDDIISDGGVTIIRSGVTLLACGNNAKEQIASNGTHKFPTPTPLDLPGPAVKVAVADENIFIQLTDGAWVGRGQRNARISTSVHDNENYNDVMARSLAGWASVNRHYAARLRDLAGKNVMFLPDNAV